MLVHTITDTYMSKMHTCGLKKKTENFVPQRCGIVHDSHKPVLTNAGSQSIEVKMG